MKKIQSILEERILVLDGAMGTMIQAYDFDENDFRGNRFQDHPCTLQGNNDLLSLTQPEVIKTIHKNYFEAGADIVETNTFSSTSIGMADYQMEDWVYELNFEAAKIAKQMADEFTQKNPEKPRFVAGSIGPTNRTASMSPDVNDPSYLRLFGKDRDLSIWRPFQMGITLFLVLTFSLLITLIWSDYSGHSLRLYFFFQCLVVITALILIRYLLLWALAWIFNLNMLFRQLLFKGVSSYGYLALIVYGLCVLYYFSPWQNSSSLLWLGLAVLGGGNLLIQGVQYIDIGKGSTSQTVYLFLYICCFKIAPWIWIYRWIDTPL